ncbi:hypothetical protein [Puniceibacterium sp. IMCC21224]|uniref:hypothetical protein n=1 Tax=Puniceibacterium sp. IMCC21224 TaxID=1618204 RepID=UPI00064DA13A|nr:hypothetical protein [Puniceibacterium sp. IMCC21224]KMK66530.1 hypothetical protein IMCC21224_111382 [Puniceibacterium sp. IMCC21224]
MQIKALFTAIVLAVAPTLVSASCSGHERQAMSCSDGMSYDSASNSCKVVSG